MKLTEKEIDDLIGGKDRDDMPGAVHDALQILTAKIQFRLLAKIKEYRSKYEAYLRPGIDSTGKTPQRLAGGLNALIEFFKEFDACENPSSPSPSSPGTNPPNPNTPGAGSAG